MSCFKIIELVDGQKWACNKEGCGVFIQLKNKDWVQCAGTGQTPVFKTPQQFSRYIHKNYRSSSKYNYERLPRMKYSYNW